MRFRYFEDTDTLQIELRPVEIGDIAGITVEHASMRADIRNVSYEQVSA